jgi:DNA-binding beta-propeller fold protein YncE
MRQPYRTLSPAIGAMALMLACAPEEEVRGVDDVQGGGQEALSCDELPKPADDMFPLTDGVATLAGAGSSGFSDGCRGGARFFNPVNVALSPRSNDLFVADFDNGLLRRITPKGDVHTLVDDPDFVAPFGMAFTPSGELYVQTDGRDDGVRTYTTGTLWKVDPNTGKTQVLARDLGRPRGLAAIGDDFLVLSDWTKHTVSIMNLKTRQIRLLAGKAGEPGFEDGAGGEARFNHPYHVVVLDDGSLLVADHGNHAIRRVDRDGRVTTWAGTGQRGKADGPRESATFDHPQGLAMAHDGTLYVTDFEGYRIRAIDRTGKVFTIAGDGQPGFRDGDPRGARFNGLEGIVVSKDGNFLYVADGDRGKRTRTGPHRVRRLDLTF